MLWSDLGLRLGEGGMRFDETARLAAVRRAITRAPSAGRAGDAHVDAEAVTNQSTIVVFRDGKETARSTGETQQASLIEILRRAIP